MNILFLQRLVIVLTVLVIPFVSLSPALHVLATQGLPLVDRITLTDKQGNIIDANSNPDNNVEMDEAVNIHFEWSIKNDGQYKNGDRVELQIPNTFKIYNEVNGQLSIPGTSDSAGTFHVTTNGRMVITFNEFVENHSNVKGEIKLSTHFNKQVIISNNTNVITFEINESEKTEIKVNFIPENTTDNITKTHLVDSYNPKEISWEIRLNKKLDSLQDVRIVDELSPGQVLNEDSVKIYKLKVHLNGSDVTTDELFTNYSISVSEDKRSFEIAFNEEINEAYIIKYSSTITDFDQVKFKNTATLKVGETSFPPQREEVTIRKGPLLEKTSNGYDPNTKEAKWKVKFNYREATLGKVELKDLLSEGHELVPDSVKVREVSFDSNGKEIFGKYISSFNVVDNGVDFSIVFHDNPITKAYEVTYKTKVTDPSIDKVKNEIKLINNGTIMNGSQSEVIIPPSTNTNITLEKYTRGYFDYSNRQQKWTIKFNTTNQKLAPNTTLTDTFPDGGMEFLRGTLVVKESGKKLVENQDFNLVPIEGDADWTKGFQIVFLKEIHSVITVDYHTKMRPDLHKPSGNVTQFKNKAVVETVVDGKTVSVEVNVHTTMNNRIVNNGEKKGEYHYQDHSIAWNVLFNEDCATIETPIIKDKVVSSLELQPDSIEIYTVKMEAGGSYQKNEKVNPDEYTVSVEGNELTVQFKEPITDRYILTYKTKVKDITQKTYKNTATIYDAERELTRLEGSVNVPSANQYVSKTGEQEDGNINWEIYVNKSKSTIKNAILHDEPSLGQKILEETIQLFKVEVDQQGKFIPSEAPIDKNLYELEIAYDADAGGESFKVKFKNEIDNIYLVKYSTKIAVASSTGQATLTNKVSFTGDGVKVENSTTTTEIIVYTTEGSGSGSGEFGSIEIEKIDSKTKEPLENAEFTLYKSGDPIRTIRTDAEGKARFDYLLFGDYVLKETDAPDGYKKGDFEENITIGSIQQVFEFTVENDPEEDNSGGTDTEEPSPDPNPNPDPSPGNPEPPTEPENPDTGVPPTEPEDPDTGVPPMEPEEPDTGVPPTEPEKPDAGGSDTEKPPTLDKPNVPEGPSNPEQPSAPERPEAPGDSESTGKPTSPPSLEKLPQTGENYLRWMTLLGMMLIVASFYVLAGRTAKK